MLEKISGRIIGRLIEKGEIKEEEKEIYQYGLEQLLVTVLDFVSIVLVGIIYGKFLLCMMFIVAFCSLRVYAGGYHASTRIGCYALTMSVVVMALTIIKYIPINVPLIVVFAVIAAGIILKLAPVDTASKPLDTVEYHYYRKKAVLILWVELVIAAMCTVMHFVEGAKCIVLALVVLAIALMGEKLKV